MPPGSRQRESTRRLVGVLSVVLIAYTGGAGLGASRVGDGRLRYLVPVALVAGLFAVAWRAAVVVRQRQRRARQPARPATARISRCRRPDKGRRRRRPSCDIFLLSLVATFNPTLLAAVTVMLLLPKPKRLTGWLPTRRIHVEHLRRLADRVRPSALERNERGQAHAANPVEDIVLGVVALAVALVLRIRGEPSFQQRRRASKEAKLRARHEAGEPTESLTLRMLGKGDPRATFVVGVVLSLPGVAYLDALDHIHHLDPGLVVTVLVVVFFCVMQQMLIELPLLGFVFAPQRTEKAVTGFKAWMARRGRTVAVIGAAVVGVWLTARGAITLL